MVLVYVCCGAVIVALIVTACVLLNIYGPAPAFDCDAGYADWQSGWSDMKKEYCCENYGRGCTGQFEEEIAIEYDDRGPKWLQWWLADMSVGLKFLLSASMALVLGCCCGCCLYLNHVQRAWEEKVHQTENEMLHDLNKALDRAGAMTGEIAVTLMWGTRDDLDLHVKLPGRYGTICAETPELEGGKLDVDGNTTLAKATSKPIENIYWPEVTHHTNSHPPIGEYTVYVKMFQKHQHFVEANDVTVVVTVQGNKDIYHLRMLAGQTSMKVCTFQYNGPERHGHHAPPPRSGSPHGKD